MECSQSAKYYFEEWQFSAVDDSLYTLCSGVFAEQRVDVEAAGQGSGQAVRAP